MKRIRLIAAAALTALGVLGAVPRPSEAQRASRHVVLISLDGFAAYYLNDPRLPLPNIRGLAAEGASAAGMTVSTPSVTWPNHTTLVTGVPPAKHGVLANGVIEASATGEPPLAINPRKTRYELVRVPTVYDAAKKVGLRTAEINWPATRGSRELDWSFPDHPEAVTHSTPKLVDRLIEMKLLSAPTNPAFYDLGSVGRDRVWTEAAVDLLKKERPHLLLLHLLNTDGQQHAHGPLTTEAYTALTVADRHVGDVLEGLSKAGLRKNTTVIVTADHGFIRVTKQIKPNARWRARGFIRPKQTGTGLDWTVQSISEGGLALVYLPGRRGDRAYGAEAAAALAGMEGVDRILNPADYGPYGLPLPGSYAQAPDLVLSAQDGYAFSNETTGEEITAQLRPTGSHGYLQSNPKLDALFVMGGRGVRKGARAERVSNLDVAPTIARLLEVELPGADGRPLSALLEAGR